MNPPLGWLWFEFKPEWTNEFLQSYVERAERSPIDYLLRWTVLGYETPLTTNQVISFKNGVEVKTTISLDELEASRHQPYLVLAVVQVLGKAEVTDEGNIIAHRIYKHSLPAWECDQDNYRMALDLVYANRTTFEDVAFRLPWLIYLNAFHVYNPLITDALSEIKESNRGYGIDINYPAEYLKAASLLETAPNPWLTGLWDAASVELGDALTADDDDDDDGLLGLLEKLFED
jgi:hypothetical protein